MTAKPAHSSQVFRPEVGSGAIFEAARILDGFYQRLAGQEFLTFNPGLALGGTEVSTRFDQPSEARRSGRPT